MINENCPYCKKWVRLDKSEREQSITYCPFCDHRMAINGRIVKAKSKEAENAQVRSLGN